MTANSHELPSALESIDEILDRRGKRELAFFLDYDGTLTPIVERPELAVLSPEMKATVARLAKAARVAVISGRELRDVRALVGLDGIYYAGSHGYEIDGPDGWHLDSKEVLEYLPRLDAAEQRLRKRLADTPGSLVERKRFSVAVHYRLVASDRFPVVQDAVDEAMQRHPGLKLTHGKKVFELQPGMDWHKGTAVRWLLDALELPPSRALPVFLGDDITDENAFAALASDGVGIIVRDEPRKTAARYALDSTGEARIFLERILEAT